MLERCRIEGPLSTAVGLRASIDIMAVSLEVPQSIKSRTTIMAQLSHAWVSTKDCVMSTASLFAIIRKQKQSRGTLAEGGMVKMCRVYMMDYWAAGKKNEMCRGMAVPGKYNVT